MPATAPVQSIHKNKREAAEYLHISTRTLERLKLPEVRIRGRVLYRTETLDKYSREQERSAVVA